MPSPNPVPNATNLPDPASRIGKPSSIGMLTTVVVEWLKLAQQQINRLSANSINSSTTASTSPPAPPSVTLYSAGDFIRNSAPTELGAVGSKYVVTGWLCTVGGQPGTWVQCRSLTGN